MINPDTAYRFSDFCKYFFKDGVVALYHSLMMNVLYMSKNDYDKLSSLKTGITPTKLFESLEKEGEILQNLNNLLILKLVVPVQENEKEKMIKRIQEKLLGRPKIEMMYLLITDQCNLCCDYCFLNSHAPQKFKPKKMDAKTAIKAVDLFVSILEKQKSNDSNKEQDKVIHLYGGEPLTNWLVFQAVVNRVNQWKGESKVAKLIKLVTVTNGTLITPEKASYFKENEISVGISIDGLPEAADKHRIYPSGKGSFADTIKGYRCLIEADVETGISCTLVPENLEEFDKTKDCLLNEIGIKDGICFNILHNNLSIPLTAEYLCNASLAMINAFETLRKKGVYEERIMRKILPFIEKRLVPYDCGGCGQQLAISPEGEVGVCHDCLRSHKYIATTVNDKEFEPWNSEVFLEWSKRSPFNMPQCFDCEAIGLCGGGCPVNAELNFGSIWALDTRFCIHTKLTLEWMIWDQYSQMDK